MHGGEASGMLGQQGCWIAPAGHHPAHIHLEMHQIRIGVGQQDTEAGRVSHRAEFHIVVVIAQLQPQGLQRLALGVEEVGVELPVVGGHPRDNGRQPVAARWQRHQSVRHIEGRHDHRVRADGAQVAGQKRQVAAEIGAGRRAPRLDMGAGTFQAGPVQGRPQGDRGQRRDSPPAPRCDSRSWPGSAGSRPGPSAPPRPRYRVAGPRAGGCARRKSLASACLPRRVALVRPTGWRPGGEEQASVQAAAGRSWVSLGFPRAYGLWSRDRALPPL